eukprot:379669-Pelagomonas_calceolata.AAC.1
MSEKDSRKRVKRGQTDGDYKADLPHCVTAKVMADWYEPPYCPLRKHWLKDGGLDDSIENVVLRTLCKSNFQCRAQNKKVHKQGKKHKTLVAK